MQCSTYPISSTCCIVWYHIQSYYLNVTIVLFGGHLGLSQVLLANPAGIENLVLHLEHVLGGLAGGLHIDRGEPLGQPPHRVVHRPGPASVLRIGRLVRGCVGGRTRPRPRLLDATARNAARLLFP